MSEDIKNIQLSHNEEEIDSAKEPNLFGQPTMIRGSEANRILGLSRHNFERCVERGYVRKEERGGTILYNEDDVRAFRVSQQYQDMLNGVVDSRNKLNDLTGKEWVPETKSYMFQKGLGADHPHAQIERQHPAPFSFQDIMSLVNFFTKKG